MQRPKSALQNLLKTENHWVGNTSESDYASSFMHNKLLSSCGIMLPVPLGLRTHSAPNCSGFCPLCATGFLREVVGRAV
jgi:hypothetical protein